jgi:hypothetical protein
VVPVIPDDGAPTDMGLKAFRESILGGNRECSACHDPMDNISFAFDHFDAVGHWIDEAMGAPIDATGTTPVIENGEAVDLSFDGHADLIAKLLPLDSVRECIGRQVAQYGLEREVGEHDACLLETLAQVLADTDGDVRAAMLAVVASPAFRVVRAS